MDQSRGDFDSTAFQEVNNILGNENMNSNSKETSVLTFKINELQKICITLTEVNKKLMDRIEQLQQSQEENNNSSSQTIFNEQYSEMQCDFNDIENIINDYKTDLNKFQVSISQQLRQKDYKIMRITEEVKELRFKQEDSFRIIEDLSIQNKALEQTKEGLLIQIEQLQTSLRKMQLQTRKISQHPSQYNESVYSLQRQNLGDFNMNVQYELQKLIEKLIKELEHERHLKRKLSDEIKRLQKDIVSLEKQIITKSDTIYNLQITALKSARQNHSSVTIQNLNINKKIAYKKEEHKSVPLQRQKQMEVKTSKSICSFTFMELINECIRLNNKQKLIIANKTIDFYIKKIQNGDFSSHLLESLTICNYNQVNPHSAIIKINKSLEYDSVQEDYNKTESEVIWNLAFVLQNLLSQNIDTNQHFGESNQQYQISYFIAQLLENRQGNQLNNILELKKLVQQALNIRRR